MRASSLKSFSLFILVPGALLLAVWVVFRVSPESAPVARGAKYTQFSGCIECHGQLNDPGSGSSDKACAATNHLPEHPGYEVECADALAYFETVRLRRTFESRVQGDNQNLLIAGEQLARKYHCFNCHGQLGQGGFVNAGSFKGYVPGYFGRDFKILTRNGDPDSVRQWIMYGVDSAILKNPVTGRIAKYFFERQAIHMPSFKSLKPEEIDKLVKYVIALNQYGPMTANMVRTYAKDSVSFAFGRNDISFRNETGFE
jgi:mono/diheme cytochrome c family protein